MTNMNLILICILVGLLTIDIITMVVVALLIYKQLKIRNELNQLDMDLRIEIKDSDFSVMDKLIADTFQYYCLFNEELLDVEYIKDDLMEKMVVDIFRKVLIRASPIYLNKLSYIYNKEYIEDIMLEKVKVTVMDYCVNINGHIND